MPRFSDIRKAIILQPVSVLDEPYRWIGEDYKVSDFLRSLPMDTDVADAGDFPRNIAEYYWIQAGERDEESWYAVGKLNNGFYFFYEAACDYTGFECQGTMDLLVSKSYANLMTYGMPEAAYRQYSNECA